MLGRSRSLKRRRGYSVDKGSFPALWFIGFIMYLVIVGRITLYDVVIGAVTGLIASMVFATITIKNPYKPLSFKRIFIGLAYIIYYLFVIEPKQHINVAKMIIGVKKIYPGIVAIHYDYKSDYATVAAANSITNTPGTVVVDIDPEKKTYYVHWLEAYTRIEEEAWRRILGSYDEWIKRIFEG